MTVTFERLGRWFLAGAALSAGALVVVLLLLEGTARLASSIALGALGASLLIQGVVWTTLQRRWFGSPAALRLTATRGTPALARVAGVTSTTSAIGNEAIPVLDLDVGGRLVRRRVRVPFNHAADVRVGRMLPVRLDPEGSPVIVVEWDAVR
ncbi:hypothetical protein EV188_1011094 [Actinomycetospora succinea]|uniref:Uncharacterized protein n=1 Tax=Actinomycetospora succinea TaxID=663603 RepID=A0A4R6VPK2_9PSEU|nr:hypothetical protein [Actinomycetospora succinea]TDQ65842.1 hypothetical protein EV188_1011094 [Actinomycetospora succinea]